ncbi:hypothetical protein [Cellulomonas sp. P24]|uniref:hypothetical protein n=1 Tax=Cellulomonas sp. P24 TaxID=2885206 RepID=UPI00216ADD39|nr:hypothetical protein [Cellulomonas sp. P24]MCR6491716.1 hypothetical protein [Cellulomonas sp. P24]
MLEMLREMGWKVAEVEDLSVAVAVVRALDLILVRSGVSEAEVAEATEGLILDPAPSA